MGWGQAEGVVAVLLLLGWPLQCAPASQPPAQADHTNKPNVDAASAVFDFGSGIRPLEHVGAGFLSGLGAAPEVSGAADYIFSTPDKYVLPLRPHGMRVGDSAARGNFASDACSRAASMVKTHR